MKEKRRRPEEEEETFFIPSRLPSQKSKRGGRKRLLLNPLPDLSIKKAEEEEERKLGWQVAPDAGRSLFMCTPCRE